MLWYLFDVWFFYIILFLKKILFHHIIFVLYVFICFYSSMQQTKIQPTYDNIFNPVITVCHRSCNCDNFAIACFDFFILLLCDLPWFFNTHNNNNVVSTTLGFCFISISLLYFRLMLHWKLCFLRKLLIHTGTKQIWKCKIEFFCNKLIKKKKLHKNSILLI